MGHDKQKFKKPDMVVDNPQSMPYPTNVGAPAFTVPAVLKNKQERGTNAIHYLETKFDQLKEEYFKLVQLAEDSELVYNAEYAFIPVVGRTYHLYVGSNDKLFLSLIEPERWPKKEFKGSFKYTSENIWQRVS